MKFKKTFAWLLSTLLIITTIPFSASAETFEEDGYIFEINGDGAAVIKDYVGTETDLVIPDNLGGVTVSEIKNEAFKNKGLTSVVIPVTVQEIGSSAFSGNHLQDVDIKNSEARVASDAFNAQITLDEKYKYDYKYQSDTIRIVTPLYELPSDYEVPSKLATKTVDEIAPSAYRDKGLTSVVIPVTVQKIGYYAFLLNHLQDVDIKNSEARVASDAFVEQITLDEKYKYDYKYQSDTIRIVTPLYELPSDYEVPSKLATKTVDEIASSAYRDKGLTSVVIPVTVQKIGSYAFLLNHLQDVLIYNRNIQISSDAFLNQTEQITTIHGYLGSTAENLANLHSYLRFSPFDDPPIKENDVLVNLRGGNIELEVENKQLTFAVELNDDPTLKFDAQSVDYTVKDNRGETSNFKVQYTLSDFVHRNGKSKLVPVDGAFLNATQTVTTVDPTENPVVSGTINLEGLEFRNDIFVEAGEYTSTLTTEVVVVPEL